ncbi:response regulator transcription factor [Paucibacter sp. M5-1]|uniref:response regulator transcription factor n=1 Tax=Paucibacter sp. M5-1 TaxID=3015998 RepID=UPI0022B8BE15|nr:response regulator transcription factor [Paucibacter sp. M5-1]MCZ7884116.1 response regulator transcription factor [Paucibacter sp. M5-1]
MTKIFQPLRALPRHNDPLLAVGINAALVSAPGIEVVAAPEGSSFPDVEVVIGDYESGMAWAHHQRFHSSAARRSPGVVVITWRNSESDVRTALQAGISGYLLGNCGLNELVDAVRMVGRGSHYICEVAAALVAKSLTRTPLTMREREILRLIADGMSNKSIASELDIALGTVKAHARAIQDKLGARSRTQAIVAAAEQGLLGPHSPLRPAAALYGQHTSIAAAGRSHQ